MSQQRQRRAVEHVEDLHKAAGSTVPGVGDILFKAVRVKVAREEEPVVGEGAELGDKPPVRPVHGDNEVEPFEVSNREWS